MPQTSLIIRGTGREGGREGGRRVGYEVRLKIV